MVSTSTIRDFYLEALLVLSYAGRTCAQRRLFWVSTQGGTVYMTCISLCVWIKIDVVDWNFIYLFAIIWIYSMCALFMLPTGRYWCSFRISVCISSLSCCTRMRSLFVSPFTFTLHVFFHFGPRREILSDDINVCLFSVPTSFLFTLRRVSYFRRGFALILLS